MLRLTINPGGIPTAALLRTLKGDEATLEIAGQVVTVPLAQLAPLWTGQYLLLWRPQIDLLLIGPGNTGEAVRWLRRRLALAADQPNPEPLSATFDNALGKQLRVFQQDNGLQPDGLAGGRTLVLLNNLTPLPIRPRSINPLRIGEMSYILDALRKAEQERHLGQPPTLTTAPPGGTDTEPPVLVRHDGSGSWAQCPVAGFLPSAGPSRRPSLRPSPPRRWPFQPPRPRPFPAIHVSGIGRMECQPCPARNRSAKRSSPKPRPTVAPASRERHQKPARPTVTPGSVTIAPVPELTPPETLSAADRRGMPALNLDIHIYSADPDKRFVVINGRHYREGERLSEGRCWKAWFATARSCVRTVGASSCRYGTDAVFKPTRPSPVSGLLPDFRLLMVSRQVVHATCRF